ncbi:MAG: hypothetical protein IKF79_00535 [Methanosphaera sp.]|nr:hypothetical protein [Methanosphaera sp.]
MTEKRFKSRCYEKQKNVVIYDKGDKLFDVSYRDFEDAFYLKMKLIPVIDKLNELAGENQYLKSLKWNQDCINEISISMQQIQLLKKENEQLKQQLEVYQELYPSGKWICDLNSDELKKELSDDWG